MDALTYDLKELCRRNPHGSKSTQAGRLRQLSLIASQIADAGYKLPSAKSIKPKHIDAVLTNMKQRGLSAGTMQNRMATIRWWAGQVNKTSILKKDNAAYGIDTRKRDETDKGRTLDMGKLERVKCPHVRMSLRLQAAFGLRREASIKIIPSQADKGTHIALQGSWTKGGRYRNFKDNRIEEAA
jgi:site-specific recombinase XerC